MDFNEFDTDEVDDREPDYDDYKYWYWESQEIEQQERDVLFNELNNSQLYEEWIDL